MRKTILFLAVFGCLLCSNHLQAQAELPDETVVEPRTKGTFAIGLNGSWLISAMVRPTQIDSLLSVASYPVLATATWQKRKWQVYTGIGGGYSKAVSGQLIFADAITSTNKSIFAQVGVGRCVIQRQRLSCILGLDFMYQSSVRKVTNDSGIDLITDITQKQYIGVGPKFQMQCRIFDRFSLGIHALAYARMGKGNTARLFQYFPNLNDKSTEDTYQDLFILPPAHVFFVFEL